MAAADHTLYTDAPAGVFEELRRKTRERKLPNAKPLGMYVIKASVPTTTASVDETGDRGLIIKLPKNQPLYLVDFQAVLTDVDAHATPTVSVSWVYTDLSTDVNIIATSTIGQGGGRDRMDDDSPAYGADISGYYIAYKVGTGAATAATGTATVYLTVYAGDLISTD